MESDYVKRTVGPALALGLAEVATIRPTDPVEYLAIWLLKHKVNLEEKQLVTIAPEDMKPAIEYQTKSPELTEDKPEDKPPTPIIEEIQKETILCTPPMISGSRPGSKLSRIMEEKEEEEGNS